LFFDPGGSVGLLRRGGSWRSSFFSLPLSFLFSKSHLVKLLCRLARCPGSTLGYFRTLSVLFPLLLVASFALKPCLAFLPLFSLRMPPFPLGTPLDCIGLCLLQRREVSHLVASEGDCAFYSVLDSKSPKLCFAGSTLLDCGST